MAAELQVVRRAPSPEIKDQADVIEVARREEQQVADNTDVANAAAQVANGFFALLAQVIRTTGKCVCAVIVTNRAAIKQIGQVGTKALDTAVEQQRAAGNTVLAVARGAAQQHRQAAALLERTQNQHRDERAGWREQQLVDQDAMRARELEYGQERKEYGDDAWMLRLERVCATLEAIRSTPKNAVILAEPAIAWIGAVRSELKRQRQETRDKEQRAADKLATEQREQQDRVEREARETRERIEAEARAKQAQVDKEARERLERATMDSRQLQIDLTQRAIKQIAAALRSGRDERVCQVVCLCIAPVASAYLLGPSSGFVVACIAWPAAYYLHAQIPGMDAKLRWMNIYDSSLDQLRSTHDLTVRDAVHRRLQQDMVTRDKHAPIIELVLSKIPGEQVQGDPHQPPTTIPAPLQPLLLHAGHPPRDFLPISLEASRS